MKVKIRRWGINGEGIAYLNKKAIFVENAIPGEVADIALTEDKGTYAYGEVLSWIEKAPRRREPLCPKWRSCGGCGLMHVDYKGQIRMKENSLKEALRRYAGYTGPIEPMIKNPEPLAYRNACKLPFGTDQNQTVTGMYKKGTNIFVPLERCLIHSKKMEQVRRDLSPILTQAHLPVCFKDSKTGLMNLVLKEFDGQVHVVLITTDMEIPQEVVDQILQIENVASLWQSVKEKDDPEFELFGKKVLHLGGAMKMSLQLEDFTLDLLPKSFFQLNTKQAIALYKTVADWIPEHSSLLVEAYSGIGAISLYVSSKADRVIGIEYIEDAVINARTNALINGAGNVEFRCGDAAVELAEITYGQHVDTLIVDPPRSGLDDKMKEAILRDLPSTVIYVSCNPATLGKDLHVLGRSYDIEKVQPFDFFSQTPHIETAVLLRKKENAKPLSNGAFSKPAVSGRSRKPSGARGKKTFSKKRNDKRAG